MSRQVGGFRDGGETGHEDFLSVSLSLFQYKPYNLKQQAASESPGKHGGKGIWQSVFVKERAEKGKVAKKEGLWYCTSIESYDKNPHAKPRLATHDMI